VDGGIQTLDSPTALKENYHAASMDEVFYKLARGAKRSE